MVMMNDSNFLQALGWAVINSLWQMALLWIIFHFITSAFRLNKPSQKSFLASSLLMIGFAWFIYTFIFIFSNHDLNNVIISIDHFNAASNEKLNKWLHSFLPFASIFYLLLLILPIVNFFRNYRYVQFIRRNGLQKMELSWRIFLKKIATRMNIKNQVQIWVSEFVTSPVTIGFLKPMILVPIAAINNLTTQQLEAVLLHELSHIRRADFIVNLIINFIQTVLYFNPFVKAFVRTVEREREKSCDEMVIQFQYDPHNYASALLLLEKVNCLSRSLVVTAAGRKSDLRNRVEYIFGIKNKSLFSFNKLAGLLAGLLCVIGLNALIVLSKPLNNLHTESSNHLSSPFFYFTGNNDAVAKPAIAATTTLINSRNELLKSKEKTERSRTTNHFDKFKNQSFDIALIPGIVNATYNVIEEPHLKKEQEEQVKEAMNASKIIIEENQWKAIEKNIADALTSTAKEKLKSEYLKEFGKLNWKKWEDKMRISFNQLDWDRINEQLDKAISAIRLDSLQKVYTDAEVQLNDLEKHFTENDQRGIPDTDITLQSIQQKKLQIQKVLDNLKALQGKNIIHL